jgi:hypothetical protein
MALDGAMGLAPSATAFCDTWFVPFSPTLPPMPATGLTMKPILKSVFLLEYHLSGLFYVMLTEKSFCGMVCFDSSAALRWWLEDCVEEEGSIPLRPSSFDLEG